MLSLLSGSLRSVAVVRALPVLPLVRRLGLPAFMEKAKQPKHVGSFDKAEKDVGTGLVGNPSCGDVLRLQLRIKDNKITDAVFKTFGCGAAIASSDFVVDTLIGKTVDEARALKNTEVAQALDLPPIKQHCSVLAEQAVDDYMTKNNISNDLPTKKQPDDVFEKE